MTQYVKIDYVACTYNTFLQTNVNKICNIKFLLRDI